MLEFLDNIVGLCSCDICIRGRKIDKLAKKLNYRDRKFLYEIHDLLLNCEEELSMRRLTATGGWPKDEKN